MTRQRIIRAFTGPRRPVPGFSTFMADDLEADITIVIGTNLAASPVDGEKASVVVDKTVAAALYDTPFPGGEPPSTGRQ